nr:MAG TPA: zinc-ribbon domain protein [Caudoviricetes sp.]
MLIKCPECGKEISDKAVYCPGCGCPISQEQYKNMNIDGEYNELLSEIISKNGENKIACIKDFRLATGTGLSEAKVLVEDYFMKIKEINKAQGFKEDLCANITLPANYRRTVHLENRILTVYNKNGKVSCQDDMSNYYIPWMKETTVFRRVSLEIVIAHNNLEPIIQIIASNDSYDALENARVFCEIIKNNAIIDIQKSAFSAYSYKTPTQNKYEKVIKDSREKIKQEEKKRKLEQKLNKQQIIAAGAEIDYLRKQAKCPKCGSTSISYQNKKLSLGRAIVGDAVAGPAGAVLGGLSSKKGYAVCLNCGKKWKL